jgi:hypothetical protein
MNAKKNRNQILFTLFALIGLTGCDGFVSSIPDREVYLKRTISIDGTLDVVGGYLYVDERVYSVDRIGYGGILIMHAQDDQFYAVDLACPNEVDPDVKIGRPDDMGICKCDSCSEEYDLSYGMGTPTKGISKESLKHYNVSFDETDHIYVSR